MKKHLLIYTAILFFPICLNGQQNCDEYFLWNNFYAKSLNNEYKHSFNGTEESITADSKVLILHGLGVKDFSKELSSLMRLTHVEHLSISPLVTDEQFMPNGGYGSFDIKLYNSNLKFINEWLPTLKQLKSLYIKTPSKETFRTLFNCSTMKALFIDGIQEINSEQDSVYTLKGKKWLPKLELIRISDFTYFPEMPTFDNVTTVIIQNTEELPAFVYGLKNLKKMHLTGNQKLNPAIVNLKKLKELSVSSLNLPDFPDGFSDLNKLKWVSLTWLEDDVVPDFFLGRMKITHLSLDSPNSIELNIQSPNKYIKELNINGINNVNLDVSQLQKIERITINNSESVVLTASGNATNKIELFQILSDSPADFTRIKTGDFFSHNSFKSLVLYRIELESTAAKTSPISLKTKHTVLDVELFKSGIFIPEFKQISVVGCDKDSQQIILTKEEQNQFFDINKQFNYFEDAIYCPNLFFRKQFPEINLTDGYAK